MKARCRTLVKVESDSNVGLSSFRVEVWGDAPFDYVRIYKIQAKDDTQAAQEGIQRFQDEMEAMFREEG